MTRLQQLGLVLLRTLIGWHFAVRGLFQIPAPGLEPRRRAARQVLVGGLPAIGSAARSAELFQSLALADPWIPWIDTAVAIALVAAGLLLMLGWLTQLGCAGAMALLAVFYLSAIPLDGLPQPRSEGTYLIVNKNLIELLAVAC